MAKENAGVDVETQKDEDQTSKTDNIKDSQKNNNETKDELNIDELVSKLNEKGYKIMKDDELQSMIDRERTKAVKTREENLRKQAEKEKLEKEKDYEGLLKQERKDFLNDIKNTLLKANNLDETYTDLINTDLYIDLEYNEAKDKIKEKIENIKKTNDEYIEKEIQKRLKERENSTFMYNKTSNDGIPKDISNLSYSELQELINKFPEREEEILKKYNN